jgi:putative ATPase
MCRMSIPLPEKLRPEILADYIGQEQIVGNGKIVNKLLESFAQTGFFPSLILWGPPGTGKTTLARIIAKELGKEFIEISAVNASSKEIKNVPQNAVLFLDEIHRFNKAQQDRLLPHVERGDFILIGATTENPSFEVIAPLLSRCRVLVLKQLQENDLDKIITHATTFLKIKITDDAKAFLIESCNGDARILLNVLDIASHLTNKKLQVEDIEEALQKKQLSFDKNGDEFYNIISAFIKSMRASQPDAALYYLARMIEAGQDPLYIARRMVILASEDVGMAQPTALVVVNEVFRACEVIGYPECAINLAHGVVYLATAKKNRSAYDGLRAAQADVQKYGNLPIPLKVLNAPTKFMKNLDYGKDYKMYDKESYLPEKLKNKKYYS